MQTSVESHTTNEDSRIVYVRGKYVPIQEASIPLMDRGFLFGDGVYEVIAVIEGRLLDSGPHMKRLERSLREIDIPNPFSAEEWMSIEREVMHRNSLANGMLYIQVSRGVAERAYQYPKNLKPTVIILPQFENFPRDLIVERGARVITIPDQRWSRCDIKSTSLLAQVLAKRAVTLAGVNEGWMVRDGLVTEGASSNAFIITQDGEVVTRSLSPAILPGITREAIIAISRQLGLKLVERAFSPQEIYSAREAFYTSSGTIAAPVVEVDGNFIGDHKPGPIVKSLYNAYMENVFKQPKD